MMSVLVTTYQYSDGGHEMGAGEEDGPVADGAVAGVALGASADVADVVISDLIFSHLFIIFTELVSWNSIILHSWNSANMTFCEGQR